MEAGSIAWVLTAAALVLFMVPGLALFYGGMVRTKNVLNMLMMNMYCIGIIPLTWVLLGYSMSKQGSNGLIGGFDFAGLKDLKGDALTPVVFLMTFAVITPTLISGAVADRLKFSAWAWFVPLWSMIVYVPVVFWLYGTDEAGDLIGFLGKRGSLDFAGGTAIHINAGVAALAFVLVLGKRKGWPSEGMPPHSMPLTVLGAGILFFGWFGFNGGSALAADGTAVQAFMNTFLAGAAATMSWIVAERLKDGHFTTLGAASGAVAGLVAITPCAGFVSSMSSIPIGLIAGVLCFLAIQLKYKFGYDDALDVVGVHLVGGIVGGLLLGFFADNDIKEVTHEGLFAGGGGRLLGEQALSIVVVLAWSFVATFVIVKVLDAVMGLRVSSESEVLGLDRSEHAETAYNLGIGSTRVS